ncbi:MAG: tetratricopeptide repeat protein [Anaerolineae bacterium]|nr:tetratricopeptide repeat protein [Anaerolineae bacterium]
MEHPTTYIPMDRRQALAQGRELPERTQGAALFADVSGFTQLTEALAQELGPRRGAEELTGHLNQVYDALITELHRFGGSVISFAGDAITCWLNGDDGLRGVACALAMQQAMTEFAAILIPSGKTVSLAVKTAVAMGTVRRFVVGDPAIQLLDVLAGETLEWLAAAEHLAGKGDVVLTPQTAVALQPYLIVSEWRTAPKSGAQFAVVRELLTAVPPQPWPSLPYSLTDQQVQPWLLPTVADQLQHGRGEFLAELRPAVALFMKFTGIDYDHDPAAAVKLDWYIQAVQRIIQQYDGALLQLTIGDKGSYLYAAFGAPIAHQDDAARAVAVAWDIIHTAAMPAISSVQIGIASGRMWTGAYGGSARRTYGVLGDGVNLSARLMERAAPDQILATMEIQQAVEGFEWEVLPAIEVKGKSGKMVVTAVTRPRPRSMMRLLEPGYALPMVGRETELSLIAGRIEQVLAGQGQIIGITAHPGMGKSRLVAEVIRLANERGLAGFGGECHSYASKSSYHVWHTIWRGFFNVLGDPPLEEVIARLEAELTQIDPALLPRLPLLGMALNRAIPDNDLTRSFDAKLRKASLESLLVSCVRARAAARPLFFVLEDSHWIDPLSHDLLEILGRAMADMPVLLVLAYRVVEVGGDIPPRVIKLPYYTEMLLTEFTPAEARHLMQLKVAQLFGADTAVSPAFVERITAKADGNPFYIEELLNYLQDRHIDPQSANALDTLDLPDSLHSLILSRIDQLTEGQKNTIKVASVIGRLFRVALLWGAYPELGDASHVQADLEALRQMELTALDTPEPELTYIFKHVVTQEATYESLPYATRARLHTQIGEYIERMYGEMLAAYVPILAHHFSHGQDDARKRRYLLLAAADAQAKYAHEAAIAYYERAMPLLGDAEKPAMMLKLGEALQTVGRWPEAEAILEKVLILARQLGDLHGRAAAQTALAEHLRKQGRYDEAAARLRRARLNYEELGDEAGIGQVLQFSGILAAQRGDYQTARALWGESLDIRRRLSDKSSIGSLLNNLGIVARYQGEYATTQRLYEESLAIRQEIGDKSAIANSLNNLGFLALNLGDLDMARQRLEEAVTLQREVGDRWALANSLNNLASVARDQRDYQRARELYRESLRINRELGDKGALAYLLEDICCLAAAENDPESAFRLYGAAAALRETIGAPLPPSYQQKMDELLAPVRAQLPEEKEETWMAAGRQLSLDEAIVYALQL